MHTQERRSLLAWLSLRMAIIAIELIFVTIVLHRFASLPTPIAFNLLATGSLGVALAFLVALLALARIWRLGTAGAASAGGAIALGLMLSAAPAYFASVAFEKPRVRDVTTDLIRPPAYAALARFRSDGANPTTYSSVKYAARQLRSYPDIVPIISPRSTTDAYNVAALVVKKLEWTIVDEAPPGALDGEGRIEAVENSLILGLPDDITIRVSGNDRLSRIDVRSSARYGEYDLGRNAERVRALLKDLYAGLDASIPTETPEELQAREEEAKVKSAKKSSASSEGRRKKRARARLSAQRERARRARLRPKAPPLSPDTLF